MKRTVAVVLAVAVLAGVAGCAPATKSAPDRPAFSLADSAWPCEGHDAQHTNCSAAVGPDRPVEKRVLSASSLAVGPDGILYCGSLVGPPGAIDLSSGSTKWSLFKTLDQPSVPAVLSNGTSVFASVDKDIFHSRSYAFAVDRAGRKLWRTWLGRGIGDFTHDCVGASGPTIGRDGTVYVTVTLRNGQGSTEGTLYAIDPSDGSIRWEFCVVNTDFRTPVLGLDGTIYVPDYWGSLLYAINPDGTKRWSLSADCSAGDPAVGRDGTVYVLEFAETGATTRMNLAAINPDGTVKWKVPTTAQGSLAIGPTGTLYGVGGALHAISSEGRELWSMPVKNFTRAIVDGAGTIYVCDGQWLRAMNPDGTEKWRFESGESSDLQIGPDRTVIVGGIVIGSAGGGAK